MTIIITVTIVTVGIYDFQTCPAVTHEISTEFSSMLEIIVVLGNIVKYSENKPLYYFISFSINQTGMITTLVAKCN